MDHKSAAPDVQALLTRAAQTHNSGQLAEAETLYRQVLARQPASVLAHNNLGSILQQQGKLDAALQAYRQAVRLQPNFALGHYNVGSVLHQQGDISTAIESYNEALQHKPDLARAHYGLGKIRRQQGQFEAALESYQQAVQHRPDFSLAQCELGDFLQQLGHFEQAIAAYQQALHYQPHYPLAQHNLGNALQRQGRLREAIECYRRAIQDQPNYLSAYVNWGNALHQLGDVAAATPQFEAALRLQPDFAPAQIGLCMSQLPLLYANPEDIQNKRQAYTTHLTQLAQTYASASLERRQAVAEAVGSLQPFYLAYQGLNDRALQKTYGAMLCQLMAAHYPQWTRPASPLKPQAGEKLRVGFVSGFFSNHSNWKIPIKGWVENLDRDQFELYGYHTRPFQDRYTHEARAAFAQFVQAPLSFDQWCQTITQHKLHVLIFPEFGMDPLTVQIGSLRLAPVQVSSWGHPDTSGMPTIDYFLSSDLMEPDDAQEYYTETLVRLPNLSIHYTPLDVQPKAMTKSDIGIPDDAVMFWCCQSLFKYLPQYDDLFPRIAQAVDQCRFVFIEQQTEVVTQMFRQRLHTTFAQYGLEADQYCQFVKRLDSESFAGVTALADVFLDSVGWSGCNSSLEAIAQNMPILTLPSKTMRSRHTRAMLHVMGMDDMIAANEDEFVSLAIRLGQDGAYRQSVSERVAQNKSKLSGDLAPVRALEKFLQHVVNKPGEEFPGFVD